jgi:transcriptional regulator with XRE-family HTH domain
MAANPSRGSARQRRLNACPISTETRRQLVGLRRHLNLTQAQVADRLGVTTSGVGMLESAPRDLTLATVQRWAAALGGQMRVVIEHPDGTVLVPNPRKAAA